MKIEITPDGIFISKEELENALDAINLTGIVEPRYPFMKPDRAVSRVFIHCSASNNPNHDDVVVLRDWHVNGNGWSDVGYHYFITTSGAIQIGRPIERSPAAQKGNNTGTIAICLHGLKEEDFTDDQKESLVNLCGSINIEYDGDVTFHGHCEVANKLCPVIDYKEVLDLDVGGNMKI